MKSSYIRIHLLLSVWVCLFGLLFTLPGCEDEPVQRNYPKIKTLEATNITGSGATFVAEVINEGTMPVTEHGFTWSLFSPDVTYDERVNLGSFSGTGRFEAEISTTLREGLIYEVCAFVKAGEYTVYGEKVKFQSLGSGAPEIIDFMPKSAGWGDTVAISGRKFSHLISTNKIIIGDQECSPFFSSDTLVKFALPFTVTNPLNTLSVSIHGNVATTDKKLSFIPPAVYGFTPAAGYWGDTITFTGSCLGYFGMQTSDGMLLNGNLLCKLVRGDDKSLSFVIPGQLNTVSNSVSISYRTFSFPFPQNLTLLPTKGDSISPAEGTWGTLVTLYGKFNRISAQNKVLFGDKVATIVTSSYDSVVVRVPNNLTEYVTKVTYSSEPFTSDFKESFTLKAPEISDFEPKTGYAGNTLTIKGKYFRKDFLTVEIGGKPVIVRSATDTSITCHVPGDLYGEGMVSVSSLGHTVVAGDLFTATNHIITGISPLNVTYGDTVIVTGQNFRSGITLNLGTYPVSLVSLTSEELQFVIPTWIGYDLQTVTARYVFSSSPYTFTSSFTASDRLQLEDFTITSVTPVSGRPGDLLVISGTKFGSASVSFGSTVAQVTAASPTELTVKVPPISAGEHEIRVTIGGRTHVCPQKYTHFSPWQRLADLPFLYDYACVFDFGEEIFVATAGSSALARDVYQFNIGTYGFEKVASDLGSEIMNPISCVLDGKGYIIGQRVLSPYGIPFEVFNPDSMTWRSLPPYPGSQAVNPCIVADDSVIYAGCGRWAYTWTSQWETDFWKYSPKTNTWTRLADFPGGYTFFSNQIYLGGKIYFNSCRVNETVYEYLPDDNLWIKAAAGIYNEALGARVNTDLNGKWYIGFGDWWSVHTSYGVTNPNINNRFYCFDPSTNQWKTIANVAVSARTFPMSFSAGGYIFIGGSQYTHLYDFWRYDPELEK